MSTRASAIALGMLAVGATAAGLVLPRMSEQQLQSAAKAAGCSLATTAIAARFIGGRP
ncbi:hypothetical protein [Comamonas sp. JC664]|uniref:hypothetical protein n=1 Tax=Comamonas sp. JC664 TaxID=2801917 RepID=UPI00174921DD|nr:hypothetical protein [Comamonas sp. JC664]MBL0698922.1 hypothetical protein [Comamonas sp. JC664]GHG79562.1 hypothetical protein GCM10012319_31550 [Comamonas sp. KCTC 72670]